jgi:CRISPR-associated endoribonuclease Cas6/Csy4 subtype I-F
MGAISLSDLRYVEFSCQGEESGDVTAEIVRQVHAFGRENGNTIGVDFPEWQPGKPLAAASKVRVFGKLEDLTKFVRHPRALRLFAMGSIARSAIEATPPTAVYASILRDSLVNRSKPSHARRRERRGAPALDLAPNKPQFGIAVTSKSTGQAFLLSMRKRVSDSVTAVQFGGYGMCQSGGIPQF